jgi:hypothetical protein
MPAASRTGLSRPSAATTSRADTVLPSVSVTSASRSRVRSRAKPVPPSAAPPLVMRAIVSVRTCRVCQFEQVPAEGPVRDVVGPEIAGGADLGRPAGGVDGAQHLERRGVGGERVPEARAVEEVAGGLEEGGRAQVGAVGLGRVHRRRGVGEKHGEARLPEGRRRGQPRDAAARDEDVDGLSHARAQAGRGSPTGRPCGGGCGGDPRARAPHGWCASPSRGARRGCGRRPRTSRRGRHRARRR